VPVQRVRNDQVPENPVSSAQKEQQLMCRHTASNTSLPAVDS